MCPLVQAADTPSGHYTQHIGTSRPLMLQAQNLQPSVNNGRMLNMLVYVKFFKVDGFQYECTVNGFYFEIEVMVDTQMVACLIPQNVSFTTYL